MKAINYRFLAMVALAWVGSAEAQTETAALSLPQPWPTALHDIQRTSRTRTVGPGEQAPQTEFALSNVDFASEPVVNRVGRSFVTASFCIYRTPDTCAGGYYSTLLSVTPRGRWNLVTRDFSVQYSGTPALGEDGTIYVSSTAGLRALSPAGNVKWTFPALTWSPVLVDNKRILVFTSNSRGPVTLYALDLQGRVQWSSVLDRTNVPSTELAVAPDGSIYYGTVASFLVGLDATGHFRWRHPTVNQMNSAPAIAGDGTVYASGDKLYAVRPDGVLKWSLGRPEFSFYGTTPAIALDGTIYIGVGDQFLALNPDGSEKWSYAVQGKGYRSLVDGMGSVYLFDGSGITALRSSGTVIWQRPAAQITLTSRTAFALTLNGTLIASNGYYWMSIGPSAR